MPRSTARAAAAGLLTSTVVAAGLAVPAAVPASAATWTNCVGS